MPYIGNTPADKFLTLAKQNFSTSATTSYTLDSSVSSTQDIALFINNVRQSPVDAYTVSGTALTLTSATAGTDEMYCVYLGKTVGTVSPASDSVTTAMIQSNAVNNAKMADDAIGLAELSATGTASSSTFLRGDNSWASAGGDNTPAFEASLSANSVGSDDTFQILSCNTETFDVGGCYNNTGSTVTLNGISVPQYGWAPNEACKVVFYATVQGECGGGNLNEGQLVIKKDGTVIKQCRMVDNDGHSRNTQTTYAMVSMDGSSNYLQAFYKIDESTGGGWTMETGSPAGSGTTIGGFKIIE